MTSWNCPECNNENGELNGYCVYCFIEQRIVHNPDKFFIRDIRIYHLSHGDKPVTPQEELFKDLFNGAVKITSAMDILERKAYREKMSEIAYKAKVHISAVDYVDGEEKKARKAKDGKPTGFERSINTDETTTNAINKVKERQSRMSKTDKIRDGLIKLFKESGMTAAEAEKEANDRMGAGAILARVKDKETKDLLTGEQIRSDMLVQPESFIMIKPKSELEKEIAEKPNQSENKTKFVNPFEKK